MKKTSFIYGIVALFVALVGCNKDEKQETIHELKVDKGALALIVGETSSVAITSGNGAYKVVSADEQIAKTSVKDNTISVEAQKEGETSLTLTDVKNKSVKIAVVVHKNIGLSKTETSLQMNKEEIIEIAGEGPFEAKADNENVIAVIEDKNLKITAKKVGNSVVIVTDTKTKKEIRITITITPSPVVLQRNQDEINRFETLGLTIESSYGQLGTYTYSAENYDKDLVEVSFKHENSLGSSNNLLGWTISVKSKGKVGETTIIIKDNQAGTTAEFKVSVKAPALNITGPQGSNPITIENVGGTNEQAGIQGSGEYEISYTDTAIVKAEIITQGDKENIKLTALKEGETTITFKDTKQNQTKTLKVIVPVKASVKYEIDGNGRLTAITDIPDNAELVIPSNVKIAGGGSALISETMNRDKVRKVTMDSVEEISMFAFQNLRNLTEVVIGDKIKAIRALSFANCTKLAKVTIKATVPPTILANTINGRGRVDTTLIVPAGTKATYEAAAHYKTLFKNIIEQ